MRQNIRTRGTSSEKTVKDIRRATRKQYSAEEKIRIVLDGLRGEEAIAELCRQTVWLSQQYRHRPDPVLSNVKSPIYLLLKSASASLKPPITRLDITTKLVQL